MVRVGHEQVEDDFDWAIALNVTDESGMNIDEHDSGRIKALCYMPGNAQDPVLLDLLFQFAQFDECDPERYQRIVQEAVDKDGKNSAKRRRRM